jgi:hypothetical protein
MKGRKRTKKKRGFSMTEANTKSKIDLDPDASTSSLFQANIIFVKGR